MNSISVNLRVLHSIRKTGMEQLDPLIEASYFSTFRKAIDQDLTIWEHKAYLMRPLLCEGDRPEDRELPQVVSAVLR